ETFARDHNEPGTLSRRHLQRLATGHGPNGQPPGPVRPATARLLERIFGLGIDELLASPRQPPSGDHTREHPAAVRSREFPPRIIESLPAQPGREGDDLDRAFDWLDERAG
ncbi:MAG: hypothetical protein GEU98_28835, partial [Pseudonocardiaceae bacterium]|nr:hypothetical protein [Pseudonocardiaceae bacterium]